MAEERETEDGEIKEISRNYFSMCAPACDSAFLLGTRYFQEQAAGVALDRAEHVASGLKLTLPAGTFKGCIKTVETSPLEPGSESIKFYCPGVGMVVDNDLQLAAIFENGGHEDDDDDN